MHDVSEDHKELARNLENRYVSIYLAQLMYFLIRLEHVYVEQVIINLVTYKLLEMLIKVEIFHTIYPFDLLIMKVHFLEVLKQVH
jgi:hypothetical protein